MRILLISSQDYIHHPVPSRHHYIFERLAERHEIHVAHFHISNHTERATKLIVEETTMYPFKDLLTHYTLNTPYQFYKFNKIIQDNKIDVVVAAHVLAGTAAILAANYNKIPVLFDLKDWFPDSAAAYFSNPKLQYIVHAISLSITKYNLKHSTKITTVSPNLVNALEILGYKSQLITNGVDTSIFKPFQATELRKKLGYSPDDFVIGFAGSMESWYDLEHLIDIPTLFPNQNIKLLFVGGSLFTHLELDLKEKVKRLHLEDKITFTGIIPYEQLPNYINCMDVCTIPLLPSRWKNIALPNKFFEYSACGKPILTTNIPNVVDFNCQNLYVYNNNYEFGEHIKTLMNTRPTYNLNFEKQDWNYKALEVEQVLQTLVNINNKIPPTQMEIFNHLQEWKKR